MTELQAVKHFPANGKGAHLLYMYQHAKAYFANESGDDIKPAEDWTPQACAVMRNRARSVVEGYQNGQSLEGSLAVRDDTVVFEFQSSTFSLEVWASLFQQWLFYVASDQVIDISFAWTSDSCAPDGFGGGAVVISRKDVHWDNTASFVSETVEGLKRPPMEAIMEALGDRFDWDEEFGPGMLTQLALWVDREPAVKNRFVKALHAAADELEAKL